LLRTGATFAFRLVQDLEAEPLPTALGESVRALSGAQAAIADAFSSARRLRQLCPGPPAEEVARLESSLRRVYDELVPMREVAFGSVVPALRRQVRGVADRTGKLAQLIVEGDEVRVDGSLLSRLMGPLSTLISNAVVHGVEAEATRQAAGKRRAGRVTVSAERVGRTLIVVVADDGAGFRRSPEEAAASGEAANADVDSGRGVGFEVVRQSVLELSGSLSVDSVPGVGTTVRLQLPVLADLVELAIVEVGPYRLALRRSVLDARAPAPASPSEDLLGLPNSRAVRLRLTDGRTVALDRVIDEGEYLVSPAPFPLNRMPWIRGTGVAPEGHIFFLVEP
jgi:chemotaxis protein histidine kinase CheA